VGFPQQVFVACDRHGDLSIIRRSVREQESSGNASHEIATGLKIVLFLTIPSALGLCMLAGPIVQTLFERGAFTPEATVLCASLLPFAAVGLVAIAGNIILTRYLFACNAVRATIVIAVATVVCERVAIALLAATLGPRPAARERVSQTLQTLALGSIVWRLLGGFDLRGY